VLENRKLRKLFGPDTEKDCTVRSCMVGTADQILLGWWNRGECNGLGL